MPRKLNKALCPKRGHLWKISSFSSKKVHEYCGRCDEQRERALTSAERKNYKQHARARDNLHTLGRAFADKTRGLTGYDMMLAAERWEKKHPDRIMVARVDDSHFSSSSLVFLTNEDPKHPPDPFKDQSKTEPYWMGTTVYYVAQCSGDKPVPFFLYPNHVDGLIDVLKKIKKRQESYPGVRREARERRKYLREYEAAQKEKKRQACNWHPSEPANDCERCRSRDLADKNR